jgi:uncharacterized membrane-anchored protein
MSCHKTLFIACCLGLAVLSPLHAQNDFKLNVTRGPAQVRLGDVAQMNVPAGFAFVDGEGTRALKRSWGEPISGGEMGMLRPPTNEHWSVIFEFDDVGYVKDDDKDKLDADKLLKSIKRGNDEANKYRIKKGSAPITLVGWEVKPQYDPVTHNLEWAIRGTSEGEALLNYNTRLLGRKGVMEAILVVDPAELPATLPRFKALLADYSFQGGQTYAEFKSGDKVAKYGLAALVVGGAAVGAAKLGLFAWLAVILKKAWKLIVIAFVAVVGVIRKIFSGRRSSSSSSGGSSP